MIGSPPRVSGAREGRDAVVATTVDGSGAQAPAGSARVDDGQRPGRRPGRADELERRAHEVEAPDASRGQGLEVEVLDDVDAGSHEEEQVPRKLTAELRVDEPGEVPGEVVGADGRDAQA